MPTFAWKSPKSLKKIVKKKTSEQQARARGQLEGGRARLRMESPKRAPVNPTKRATALAAVLGWLLSFGVTIDPDVILQLNSATLSTLSLRVVEKLVVTLSRPLVSGAAALMEVLSRVLLLLLALLLCAAPTHREAILQRARSFLRDHVEVAVRCAHQPSPLRPSPLYAAPPPAAVSLFHPLRL